MYIKTVNNQKNNYFIFYEIGLDRYISLICGASSIREVIAFPKTMDGKDLMSGAPAPITEEDKKLYHIQVLNQNKIKNVL